MINLKNIFSLQTGFEVEILIQKTIVAIKLLRKYKQGRQNFDNDSILSCK